MVMGKASEDCGKGDRTDGRRVGKGFSLEGIVICKYLSNILYSL